jgi:predicted alpha-1,2-mannosidase
MKINQKFGLLVVLCLALFSCNHKEARNYIQYVDPMIGTALANTESVKNRPGDRVNNGQTTPAVTAPLGMTQWTPQTQPTQNKCIAPFYFGTTYIQGFRATHWLNGSCTQDYGSFTVFPTNAANDFRFLPDQRNTYYLLDRETLSPAYLSTLFPEISLMTELTATKRCGFFKFSWLDAKKPTIVIDVNNGFGEGYIKIDVENKEISGYNPVRRIYNGTGEPAGISGFFVAKFDKTFTNHGTYAGMDFNHGTTEQRDKEKIGAYVSFDSESDVVISMKIGTSFTSIENARNNLETEIPDWDFIKTKTELENNWNEMLGQIDVEGGSDDDYTKFYTAMYHSLFHPRLFSDVNGDYPGFADDTLIHKAEGFDYYDDMSNWDIYRAQMPLLSIIAPQQYNDMVKSLIVKAEQGGWLPIFPMWNSYTSAMIGDHGSAIIADAAMKGFDFDLEKAYLYMRKNAFETPDKIEDYIDGKGRRALTSYMQLGYVPLEDEVEQAFHKREQVSRTIEYAYDDWAVAQVAKKLGKEADYKELSARALNYANVFDESKGWVCGRFADGTFTDEFGENDHLFYITEGSPKHYTFYVPHDVAGLINLMGGKEIFQEKLNQMVDNQEYWHGNEPCHQIPYLFNYVGDWEKTQKTVKTLLKTEYGLGAGGISGNDDAGQMSAWYVFSAAGFYPVCPGSNEYQLSSPIFEKVTFNLDKKYYPGGRFVLSTEKGKNYDAFSKLKLNGKEIEPVIKHEDLQKGGKLEFSKGKLGE